MPMLLRRFAVPTTVAATTSALPMMMAARTLHSSSPNGSSFAVCSIRYSATDKHKKMRNPSVEELTFDHARQPRPNFWFDMVGKEGRTVVERVDPSESSSSPQSHADGSVAGFPAGRVPSSAAAYSASFDDASSSAKRY